MKRSVLLTTCLFMALAAPCNAQDPAVSVPLGGNAWLNKNAKARLTDTGLINWVSSNDTVGIFVRLEAAGTLNLSLRLRVTGGASRIKMAVNNRSFIQKVDNKDFQVVKFGGITVKAPGYQQVRLVRIGRSLDTYADVSDLLLSGSALSKGAAYVKNNESNYFYWGHRGPSVHLNYQFPPEIKNTAEWFYSEITVPEGNDVQGSYFMANGFNVGYFGMQVNSPTERHVLFSVWAPFTTDDPGKIPDSLKIRLLKKGPGVYTGEFGNEGSGGQSYLNFPWRAGKTYAFLTHAEADAASKTTVYTAYFRETGQDNWLLIASFKRPQSGFYLERMHSFLENFDPSRGNIRREALYGNQWAVTTTGKWIPAASAIFTVDATANINYRKDYSGGVAGDRFYLRNCGFFNDFTPAKSLLNKTAVPGDHPAIDFTKLP
ncbi:DUF3472 domain-containing protein [Hufsiella ginkgonis]|uniref:DUF3472 domain-containing protein n=1 Tax=Hufsiella ginkgonis TaxID=2695274 RepID=A0A7K1XZZ3_9SPHI|nr:DUF3472 domain-containing protein [Hufsiella ginkgonis]MXV16096.1 DUF3472 domain-containing protein [Hufsiella ginkgonis]